MSSPDGGMALPLERIERTSDAHAIDEICRLLQEHEIDAVIVGLPVLPDGRETAAAARVRSFAAKLERRAQRPLRFVAETLSSVEARERLRQAGFSGEQLRRRLDSTAAAIILEDELSRLQCATAEPVGSDNGR